MTAIRWCNRPWININGIITCLIKRIGVKQFFLYWALGARWIDYSIDEQIKFCRKESLDETTLKTYWTCPVLRSPRNCLWVLNVFILKQKNYFGKKKFFLEKRHYRSRCWLCSRRKLLSREKRKKERKNERNVEITVVK